MALPRAPLTRGVSFAFHCSISFNYANPHWSGFRKGTGDVTVREALELAAARMNTEFADAPELRADIHYTIGEVYRTREDYQGAIRHFRQSLDLYRQVYGERHPKVARGIYYVCTVMDDAEGAGIEEIEPVLRQAIGVMRETDPENVNLPHMLQTLAGWIIKDESQRLSESRLAEAESIILEVKALFLRHYGERNGSTISADSTLASLAFIRGDLARAESLQESVSERYLQVVGESDSYIGTVFHLAEVKLALGKWAEAETLLKQATVLGRRNWGADDPRFERLLTQIREASAAVSNQSKTYARKTFP